MKRQSPLVHKLRMRRQRREQDERDARRVEHWAGARKAMAMLGLTFADAVRRYLRGRFTPVPKTGWRRRAQAEAALRSGLKPEAQQ